MFSFFFRKRKKAAPAAVLPRSPATGPPPPDPPPRPAAAPEPAPLADDREGPATAALRARSPEDLCGIVPGMDRREIRDRLAWLFRRHNRAASSLDPQLRAEAEIMLEAIVDVHHRHVEAEEDTPGGTGPGVRAG